MPNSILTGRLNRGMHDRYSKRWIFIHTIACFFYGMLFLGHSHAKTFTPLHPSSAGSVKSTRMHNPLQYHPQYAAIGDCIQRIQSYVHQPNKPQWHQNMAWKTNNPGFLQLQQVLQKLCFLSQKPDALVSDVQSALRQFQRACDLPETGILDAATQASLHGNHEKLQKKLHHAAEKWRSLGVMPHHYALTNIPAFFMDIMVQDKVLFRSRVMVGRLDSRTPTFSGFIYSMGFNPTWIVPRSRYSTFQPCVGKDGFYMQNGQLLQKPGPKNHLGQVKFLTQRSDAIIFHSTHEPERFDDPVRAYSLGCVRVQKFDALAKFLLSINGMNGDTDDLLQRKKSQTMTLRRPFPVYVVYHTLWIQNGVLMVFPDIYEKH